MDRNRRWLLLGLVAGVAAAVALLFVASRFVAPDAFASWGWVSRAGLLALAVILGVSRWRAGGWPEVRRWWWWFALLAIVLALGVAGDLDLW